MTDAICATTTTWAGPPSGPSSSGGRALSRWPKVGRATEPPCRRLGPFGFRSLPRLCRSVGARPRPACVHSRSLSHRRWVASRTLTELARSAPLPLSELATSVADRLDPALFCCRRWSGRLTRCDLRRHAFDAVRPRARRPLLLSAQPSGPHLLSAAATPADQCATVWQATP